MCADASRTEWSALVGRTRPGVTRQTFTLLRDNLRSPMRSLLFATSLVALVATPVLAQTAQQKRMTSCNAEATAQDLKGDARKTFMSDCLSGKTAKASDKSDATAKGKSSAKANTDEA